MQFLSVLSALLLAGATFAAFTADVTFDPTYDHPEGDMMTVACSEPLADKYPTFGDVPSFPYIGGVEGVTWNSTQCGSCYNLTNGDKSIYLTAIDYAGNGFNVAVAAYHALGDPEQVEAEEVDRKWCNLIPLRN